MASLDVWRWSPVLTANTLELPWEASYPAGNYNYNTNLVPPERLPKTRKDLLDPWWKGKLCEIDPLTYAGIDYALWGWFRESGYADWYPEFFYDYFYRSERHVLGILGGPDKLNAGDCAMLPSWVGTVGVGRTKYTHLVDKATWIKTESFAPPLPGRASAAWGLSVLAKSPHPNAALVFANWLMSKEFQDAYAKVGYGAVNRRDVKHQVEEKYWPKELVTEYWVPEDKWLLFEQYSYSSKAGIFKLMKEGMSKDTWLKWLKDTSMAFWGTYPPPLRDSFTWEQ